MSWMPTYNSAIPILNWSVLLKWLCNSIEYRNEKYFLQSYDLFQYLVLWVQEWSSSSWCCIEKGSMFINDYNYVMNYACFIACKLVWKLKSLMSRNRSKSFCTNELKIVELAQYRLQLYHETLQVNWVS